MYVPYHPDEAVTHGHLEATNFESAIGALDLCQFLEDAILVEKVETATYHDTPSVLVGWMNQCHDFLSDDVLVLANY